MYFILSCNNNINGCDESFVIEAANFDKAHDIAIQIFDDYCDYYSSLVLRDINENDEEAIEKVLDEYYMHCIYDLDEIEEKELILYSNLQRIKVLEE